MAILHIILWNRSVILNSCLFNKVRCNCFLQQSIGHCLDAGADLILRIKNKAFNLYDSSGQKIILSDWLLAVGEKAAGCTVYINGNGKKQIALRLCAKKKTKEEVCAEEKRLKRSESKKQKTYSEDTRSTHRYMFVITSLPAEISAEEILSCYRLRWQVELVFKRMKSLLQLGNIPTKTKGLGEVWISGKILLSLLTEKYLGDIDPPHRPSENSDFLRSTSGFCIKNARYISLEINI